MIKNGFALLLALLLVAGNLLFQSFRSSGDDTTNWRGGFFDIAAQAADEDIYRYVSSGGITMITGTKVALSGAITLPSMLGGYPVAYIGAYAFENCTGITSVSFPNTLTNINDFAFYGCRALQSVAFSDNLRIIQSCAFRDCVSLVSFHMPDTITFIGSSIFWGCSMLSDVTLSSQITTIPVNTFNACPKLSEIVIPAGVTRIGNFAFCGTALTSVIIPSAVTYIEYNAFASCTQLESVVLPPGLTEISKGLFENCSRLRTITIPAGVTVISEEAFRNCRAMTDITLNTGLLTIGKSAFTGCESLQLIEIPATVSLIGDYAFSSCYDLISITIPQTTVTIGTDSITAGYQRTIYCNPGDVFQYAVSNNIMYQLISPVTITFDANGGTGSKTVTQNCGTRFPALPVVAKSGYTCYGWQPAVPIITPNVNTIYTAQWRPNIYTITFDANGGIGGWTKQKSYGDALIAPAVTKELYLFNGWSPSVPAAVPAQNAIYTAQWRPIYTYTISNGKAVITGCDTAISGKLAIPPEIGGYPVESLGYRAFEGCSGLTVVTIPDSIAFIDQYAFSGCTRLTSITIPDSVMAIGDFAYKDCTDLAEIILPEALTDIGTGVFFNTAWFNAQPTGNVYIGNVYLVYKGLMTVNTKITVMQGTIGIADSAFSSRSGIVKMTLPDSLLSIGASAFYGCTALAKLVIPASVQNIGKLAFVNCSAMEYCCYPQSYGHDYADMNSIAHTLVAKITFDANGGGGGTISVLNCGTALTAPAITKQNCVFSVWEPALPGTVPCVNSATYTAQWEAAYTYIISGGEATITGISTAYAGALTIPGVLEGCPVTVIGENAGMDCVLLTSLVLPDSIITVESGAFLGCTALLTVALCENISAFGAGAFYGCSVLTNTTLPASAEDFGENVFGGCPNLTVYCYPKTAGAEYADKNSIPYVLIIQVMFHLNGGTGTVPETQTALTGSAVALPAQGDITRKYYTFLGWAASASASGPLSSYTTDTDNSTLYAVWSRVPVSFAIQQDTSAVIDGNHFIYGLQPGITQADFENTYISVSGDGRLAYLLPENGGFGTGTQVNLIDNLTGETLCTYTLVIYGDVNGDGNIDTSDAGVLIDYENFVLPLDQAGDAAALKSADLNGDGNVDTSDAGLIIDAENFLLNIDQTTGAAT